MKSLFDLSGKTAIVTGGSRGLGKALAIGLSKAGANIVIGDVLNTEEVEKEIEKNGQESLSMKVDVREKEEVRNMVEKTDKKFGRIDILVNNAGINMIKPTLEMREEEWDRVLDVNLKGQFLCAQEVGEKMINQGHGKIINISSVNGEFAFPNAAAYNASKAGVIMLTKTLAYEWGKYNVNVNAICPGFMDTSMLDEIHDSQEGDLVNDRLSRIPLGRFAKPEDLVGTAIYLASKASDYMTGHSLYVDGGWTIGWPGVEKASMDPGLDEALQKSSK